MNGLKNNKIVNIGGGGIAGLSAAQVLKLNGYNPVVYERELNVGKSRQSASVIFDPHK